MGKRSRSRKDAWWKRQVGGMPIWGAGLAFAFLALVAVVTITSTVGSEAAPRPTATGTPRTEFSFSTPDANERQRVVVIGDSYAEGAGSSTSDRVNAWPAVLGREMGWDVSVLAVGGSGYLNGLAYAGRLPAAVEADPDVVLVAGGRNDMWHAYDDVRAATASLLTELRAQLPGAALYVVAPWWDDDPAPGDFDTAARAITDAAIAAGATVLDAGQPLQARPELLSSDGVHPNDAGHAAIAEAIADTLRR